ncbi:MAG: IS3 family transposase, partial [Gilliamella sp.]|uniref:IS3 family transposase n=1 Tax=Gilliamella sp. TaxID=1891236 RepID=UPI00345A40F8|nr:IS3 family transposase [Gilliamella sp.]
MKNHLTCYPVTRICSLLGVSSSGYYAWLKRANKSAKLSEYIQKQYWQHKARLGAPSLLHDAREAGYQVSERIISRVLQQLGLRSKAARKFKHKTDKTHHNIAPNTLDRQFNPDKPNT